MKNLGVDPMNWPFESLSVCFPPFKGRVSAAYYDSFFLDAIRQPERLLDSDAAEILLDRRNRVAAVEVALSSGQKKEIVAKQFSSAGINRLKSLFLPSKALRAWRGAEALVERGIETPYPAAYLESRKGWFIDQSFFLGERISGAREIRQVFRDPPASEFCGLLQALGRHLAFCHSRGILHGDLSDGNILVKKHEGQKFTFYLLDTNRIRVRKRLGRLRRVKSLIRLGIPSSSQRFFLQEYFGQASLKNFIWFWYKLNKSRYTFYVGLKKKLRLRQLARRLKIY